MSEEIDSILSFGHYNLLNYQLKDVLPKLKEKGVAVFNASPLCLGLLTGFDLKM